MTAKAQTPPPAPAPSVPPPPPKPPRAPPVPAPAEPAPAVRAPVASTSAPAGTSVGAAVAATDTGIPASAAGAMADGGLLARIGSGLRLTAEQRVAEGLDLSALPQPLPGVQLKRLSAAGGRIQITGDLTVPFLDSNGFALSVDRQGNARVSGGGSATLRVPALGSPILRVSLDESGQLSGGVRFSDLWLVPRTSQLQVTGAGDLALAGGKVSGRGEATIAYPRVGTGTVAFGFSEAGQFTGSGQLQLTPPFLDGIHATITSTVEGKLTAQATIMADSVRSPLPGLTLTAGTITVGYDDGVASADFAGFVAAYAGVGSLTVQTLSVAGRRPQFNGDGTFQLNIPGLSATNGAVTIRNGAVSGRLQLSKAEFPAGLPLNSGTFIVTLSENGQLGVSSTVGVSLGPAGTGTLSASYDQGNLALGAEIDLTIPGLQPIHVTVAYSDGVLAAATDIPVNTELIPGLEGTVHVAYVENRWSGETTLNYSADDGKLSGSITVTVSETEQNTLQVGGIGTVTAQLMPTLSGTLTATILPEGGVDVSGRIEVTEPIELFPEQRLERELFSHSQNIPLWAILMAVIRIRAGVRAGIGPGQFRNITVEGSYTLGASESDPSFTVSGELFIPAFVEGYVSFGAGLGLDVLLGSLTGGIEGVATAGLYGAISVVPELSYAEGNWAIDGTATLAAGARLKLGLNAWAEVEALWVTVWENEWKLAEHVMPLGPDLALRAHMNYVFGRPEPPTLEFTTSDIDAASLIESAMPKDAPPSAGAREALENKAEWQGALREQRAAPVPSDLAAQAADTQAPPAAPARPPKNDAGPPPPELKAAEQAQGTQPAFGAPPGTPAQRSAAIDAAAKPTPQPPPVPANQLPNADQPRYPKPVSLAMLDEPPVPPQRTHEQEVEDVESARRAVELASAQASDSDALDNYFPKIKHRFRLTSLGYEGDFGRGFWVEATINPALKIELSGEPIRNEGVPGDTSGTAHKTKVDFWTTGAFGDLVGVEMIADPLGPDHEEGTNPTGQEALMNQLDAEFIRGHLLNEQLGGPGEARNMFPITKSANAIHNTRMEEMVKKWVNADRYWVRYKVCIEPDAAGLQPAKTTTPGWKDQYLNSTLTASASVLGLDLVAVKTIQMSTASTYLEKSVTLNAALNQAIFKSPTNVKARQIDEAVAIQTTGGSENYFPQYVRDDIAAALAKTGNDWSRLATAIDGVAGFTEKAGPALQRAYALALAALGDTVTLGSKEDKFQVTRLVNDWDEISAALKSLP